MRPRLVLLCGETDLQRTLLESAEAGDVCAIIAPAVSLSAAPELARDLQTRGIAVLTQGPAVLYGLDGTVVATADEVKTARHDDVMIAAGPAATRHDAMLLGEAQPDALVLAEYGDRQDQQTWHTAPVELTQWWSEIMEIPAIAVASSIDDTKILAATGVEFIGLTPGVWNDVTGPAVISSIAPTLQSIGSLTP